MALETSCRSTLLTMSKVFSAIVIHLSVKELEQRRTPDGPDDTPLFDLAENTLVWTSGGRKSSGSSRLLCCRLLHETSASVHPRLALFLRRTQVRCAYHGKE